MAESVRDRQTDSYKYPHLHVLASNNCFTLELNLENNEKYSTKVNANGIIDYKDKRKA